MKMPPGLRGVIVAIFLVVAMACLHGPSSISPALSNQICVTNQSIGNYRLKINGKPAGSVYSGESKVLRISTAEASSGEIRLFAHPIGSGGERWSTVFNMNQYNHWTWDIQNSQVTTFVNLTPGVLRGCE